MIEFGPFSPDQPDLAKPHLVEALNVTPTMKGYGPFKSLAALSDPLPGRCRGAGVFRDSAGDVHILAGDGTSLRELQRDGTWTDISRTSGGAYTMTSHRWSMAQFSDLIVQVNYNDAPQKKTLTNTNPCTALGGSPPRAKFAVQFRDFIWLGYTENSPFQAFWSSINNAEGWTPGTDLCDFQTFPDGGYLRGFVPGEVLLIFQESKIRRASFVGAPIIFQIDVIQEELGCLEPGSIVKVGSRAYFLALDGFHVIDQLGQEAQISEGWVNDWFFRDVSQPFLYRMSAAVDFANHLVKWSYTSVSSPDGTPDTVLSYYWPKKRWSVARYGVEILFNAQDQGYGLDELDAIAPSIDAFDITLDDPVLKGGGARFGGFGTEDSDIGPAFGVFTGAALAAQLTTGDFELIAGKISYVSSVEPVTDSLDITLAVASRDRQQAAVSFSAASPLETHGGCSLDAAGRYHRFRAAIPAASDWTFLQGLSDFEAQLEGEI